MIKSNTWILKISIALLAIGVVYLGWQFFKPKTLPPGLAGGNGRIEAVEIDVATRTSGRIKDVLVNEGDFVRAGQVLAKMDTAVLEAQLREAGAQLRRAHIGIETAGSQVVQREAEGDKNRFQLLYWNDDPGPGVTEKGVASELLSGNQR
jgi:HlyD family secretion protein